MMGSATRGRTYIDDGLVGAVVYQKLDAHTMTSHRCPLQWSTAVVGESIDVGM